MDSENSAISSSWFSNNYLPLTITLMSGRAQIRCSEVVFRENPWLPYFHRVCTDSPHDAAHKHTGVPRWCSADLPHEAALACGWPPVHFCFLLSIVDSCFLTPMQCYEIAMKIRCWKFIWIYFGSNIYLFDVDFCILFIRCIICDLLHVCMHVTLVALCLENRWHAQVEYFCCTWLAWNIVLFW